MEFDWFAVDRAGQVAAFSVFGFGPVPCAVVPHADALDEMYRKDVGEYATAGLWVYEWAYRSGPYQRIRVPGSPVRIDALRGELARLARLVVLDLSFAGTEEVTPAGLGMPIVRCD